MLLKHRNLDKTQEGQVIVVPGEPEEQHHIFMLKTAMTVGGQLDEAACLDSVTDLE